MYNKYWDTFIPYHIYPEFFKMAGPLLFDVPKILLDEWQTEQAKT